MLIVQAAVVADEPHRIGGQRMPVAEILAALRLNKFLTIEL